MQIKKSPDVCLPCAGQFGTRLQGGKDAASARYIFTRLEPITRVLFNEADDKLLAYLNEEGQSIEPQWSAPRAMMLAMIRQQMAVLALTDDSMHAYFQSLICSQEQMHTPSAAHCLSNYGDTIMATKVSELPAMHRRSCP